MNRTARPATPVLSRVATGLLATVAVLALGACSGEELPRDAGSGAGDGYGVPRD